MKKLALVCTILVAVLLTGCVRTMGTAPVSLMTETAPEARCDGDPRLFGVWKAKSFSNLGPATLKSTMRCDCTYKVRYRLFGFLILRESGPFRVEGEEIVYGRIHRKDESSYFETRTPFRFDEGQLVFEEDDGTETHLKRIRVETCGEDP